MSVENFLGELGITSKVYDCEALIMNVTEDILVAMESKNVSKADLAKLMNKSKSFVTQTLSGSRNMTLRTLSEIAFNLNIDVKISFKNKRQHSEVEKDRLVWEQNCGFSKPSFSFANDEFYLGRPNSYKEIKSITNDSDKNSWYSLEDYDIAA